MTTILDSSNFIRAFILALPLIIGGILHMLAVKRDILSYFKIPIHKRLFGQNKTWRGFIIMPLATWPGVIFAMMFERIVDLNTPLLLAHPSWRIALVLGLGYCLAELPNSFLKRRLGIKEGLTSDRFKWFFIILDQADSAIGCMLAYKILLDISWTDFWLTIVLGTLIHLFFNILLYKLKIRKNPY